MKDIENTILTEEKTANIWELLDEKFEAQEGDAEIRIMCNVYHFNKI